MQAASLCALTFAETGAWTAGEPYAGAPNASFGTHSSRFGLHYLVDERSKGVLRVLRRESTGWQPLARVPTGGADPCYVALDPTQGWLAVANYGSGSTALFRLDPYTGLPGDPTDVLTNHGHGPVADRQEGPHAHCAIFGPDGKWLYQTDLRTDQVLAFGFDPARGLTGERMTALAVPPGSGPRHLMFHPHLPLAYLVSELASTVTTLDVQDGMLSLRQTVSALPEGCEKESLGGHLALNAAGTRLYVSNRGHDSIAVFKVDEAGALSLLQHAPSLGASPRFFLLAGDRLFLANEEGNSVAAFAIAADGTLAPLGSTPVMAPVYVFK